MTRLMVRVATYFLVLFVACAASAAVPAGAEVPVSLVAVTDNGAVAQVAMDVVDSSGQVVISRGTPVVVTATVERARRIGRAARAEIDAVNTQDVSGAVVNLTGHYVIEGRRKVGKAVGLTVGMSFLYPGFSLLHLLHRGGELENVSGQMFMTYAR